MAVDPTRRSETQQLPHQNAYAVGDGRVVAGEYPGSRPGTPSDDVAARVAGFLDAGITAFVDLTDPADGLEPYAESIAEAARERGVDVEYDLFTIRDMDVCEPEHMNRMLDRIDEHVEAGRRVYVHCWGGIGRTGMVVGCWLVRHGASGDEALTEVTRGFESMSPTKVARHRGTGSPQTPQQRNVVKRWAAHDRVIRESRTSQA